MTLRELLTISRPPFFICKMGTIWLLTSQSFCEKKVMKEMCKVLSMGPDTQKTLSWALVILIIIRVTQRPPVGWKGRSLMGSWEPPFRVLCRRGPGLSLMWYSASQSLDAVQVAAAWPVPSSHETPRSEKSKFDEECFCLMEEKATFMDFS